MLHIVCCLHDVAGSLSCDLSFTGNDYSSLQILLVCRLPITCSTSLLQGSWHVVLTMSVFTEDITEWMVVKVVRL